MDSQNKTKVLAILNELDTKGNPVNSAIETGKTLIIGIMGAGIGVIAGKPSLLYGIGTAFAGHYFNEPRITSLGMGLIASGGYAMGEGLKGVPEGIDGFKDRLKLFGANLKERLYLDKFMKHTEKPKPAAVAGVGEVQYFKYPNPELDLGALDAIEDEIRLHSELFEKRQMAGTEQEISGTEQEISGAGDELVYGPEDNFSGATEDYINGIEEKMY